MVSNFALIEVPVAGPLPLAFPYKTIRSSLSNGNFVGFQRMSVPELTIEHRQIRQGNWPYLHSVPIGFVSGGNITLEQGVLRLATDMYLWWTQAVNGIFAPRRNMIMTHTRLDKALPARMLLCHDCVPVSWKPASDFDALSSEVSVELLTLWTPRVQIIPAPASDAVPRPF